VLACARLAGLECGPRRPAPAAAFLAGRKWANGMRRTAVGAIAAIRLRRQELIAAHPDRGAYHNGIASPHSALFYLVRSTRCATPQSAHDVVVNLASLADLAVAPLAPLGIAQHQGDGFALVRVAARQAMRAVGGNPEEDGVALRSLAHIGRYLCKSRPGGGENAVITIAQPVILAVRRDKSPPHNPMDDEALVFIVTVFEA
jgi:hypothetical protein